MKVEMAQGRVLEIAVLTIGYRDTGRQVALVIAVPAGIGF
jgi:hypothetical protein